MAATVDELRWSASIASQSSDSHSGSLDCQRELRLAKEPDALIAFHHRVISLPRTKTYKYKDNIIFPMHSKHFYSGKK